VFLNVRVFFACVNILTNATPKKLEELSSRHASGW
jgi:hypothetical protein